MLLALNEGTLSAAVGPIVHEVSAELSAEPDALGCGLFLSARALETSSRILFRLGRLAQLHRLVALHRYEPYWMKPAVGGLVRDVPAETQSLLVKRSDGLYVILIPLVSELFRFSLRGEATDELTLVAETGDAFTAGEGGLAAFVAVGDDPYALMQAGARSVAARLHTRLRVEKPLPDFIDGLGWCTWDAFYQDVSAERVLEGLGRFRDAGVPLRFMILDDGWQSVARRPTGERRLTAFAANEKFPGGLAPLVSSAKRDFGLKHFLVWHAVCGYWGGVDGEALPAYGVREHARHFGEGVLRHMPTFNNDWWGALVGLVPATHIGRFYDDYHAALEAAGVDGIKVDSQAVLEALAQGEGGRVPLSRAYRVALETSAQRHFGGRLINCMSNAQETWYFSPDSTLLRSSIDFFPTRPEWHGLHLFTNAQVGLWFGEFMWPDWDMFQSDHAWGAYHAAGRALSGGPIYVSDKPGLHDTTLLRRLVCSDGSVLRCDEPGRPTLDALFHDPTREPVPMKIYSKSGESGFVGAFNGHWTREGQPAPVVTAQLGPSDVPGFSGKRCACYFHVAERLEVLEPDDSREFALGEREFELVTVTPLDGDDFAPIGLAEKLNSAAAIRSLTAPSGQRRYRLRDGGTFLAHSRRRPRSVRLDDAEIAFEHDGSSGTLRARVVQAGDLCIEW